MVNRRINSQYGSRSVAIGWLVFQTWACDVATSSTTVPDETPDTDETVPVSEDSTNSTEP